MRIATYNLWNSSAGMPERKFQLVEEIRKIRADVICLQEVPDQTAHLAFADRCGYPFDVFHAHANEEEGVSIFSQYPIVRSEYDQYCLFAEIEIANQKLLVINAHLPWDRAAHRESAVLHAMEKLEGGSADCEIFLGDFNCSDRSGVHQFLLGEQTIMGRDCGRNWFDLAEAYAQRHALTAEHTLDVQTNPRCKGNPSMEVSRRSDRIYLRNTYPKELPILGRCETFGKSISAKSGYAASDHYGVYADLNFI